MKSRPVHVEIDADFIATHTPWEVIEPLWWSVSVYDGPQQYEKDLQRFTTEQRHLFACICYIGEVNNGGHDQFYANSIGIVWRDALAGFRAFGEDDAADILAESAQRLGGSPSLDRTERLRLQLYLRLDFRDLDERFYRLQGTRRLQDSLARCMRSNAQAFVMSGALDAQPGA